MKYLPDTYQYHLIENIGLEENEFEFYQIKYRNYVELLLMSYLDFSSFDTEINNMLPVMEDKDYNFYHKNSTLGSNYVYLRNNIHIERLTKEEFQYFKNLCSKNEKDISFITRTFGKVLYEYTDTAMYGMQIPKYEVSSKGLVFEFSFDQKKIKTMEQIKFSRSYYVKIFDILVEKLHKQLNIPISLVKYNGIPDLFFEKDKTVKGK